MLKDSVLQEQQDQSNKDKSLFEDVPINFVEVASKVSAPKRRGLFTRFGEDGGKTKVEEAPKTVGAAGMGIGFGWAGRKRGQSTTQGSEMESMNGRTAAETPRVVVVGD